MNKNGFATLAVVLVAVAVLVAGGVWYYTKNHATMHSTVSNMNDNTETAQATSTATSLPTAYINTDYDAPLGVRSDTETVTTSGQLPPGLTVRSFPPPCPMNPLTNQMPSCGFTADLEGKPTQAGSYSFNVAFTATGQQNSRSFEIQVQSEDQNRALRANGSKSYITFSPPSPDSVKTYTDPNGAFSFEYPKNFTTVNGNIKNYLSEELVEFDAPMVGGRPWFMPPLANAAISYVNVSYSPAGSKTSQSSCENPGAVTPSGQTNLSSINGVNWFEGSQGSIAAGTHYVDDAYQLFRNGSCWGLDFEWIESSLKPSNNLIISSFEENILGTMTFLNDNPTPYRESPQGTQ